MAHPDSLRHRRFRMTGTEPHAPRATAGRGPNWDRGPGAGHAGAARSGTTLHRRPWAQLGPPAVDGPRRLRVDACASRHRRPRDHSWDRGLRAGRRSCATRSVPTRLRMPILAPPAAGPAREPRASGGPEELRDSVRACGPFAVTSDRLLSIHIRRSRSVMTRCNFIRELLSSRRKFSYEFELPV